MRITIEVDGKRVECPCVGKIGQGLFVANFAYDGKPLLFSGAIRVHRSAGTLDSGATFVFECFGKLWAGGYINDPASARWVDENGEPVAPVSGSEGLALSTAADYYGKILPAIKRLERTISAEAGSVDVEPCRVGLVDCYRFASEELRMRRVAAADMGAELP